MARGRVRVMSLSGSKRVYSKCRLFDNVRNVVSNS